MKDSLPPTLSENERRIIEDCLFNLRSLEGCQADFVPVQGASGASGELHLSGPWGDLNYRVLTRMRLSATTAEAAIHQCKDQPTPEPMLLFSDYLPEEVSNKLRRSGVDFVDAAGNARICHPPLYVDVAGRKRRARPSRPSRSFQGAGLRLIFLLLREPGAVTWTYRDLAQAAGIALGAVVPVFQELQALGFLQHEASEVRKLIGLQELQQRWEIGYVERLRPKLVKHRCRLSEGLGIEDLVMLIRRYNLEEKVLVGGELGASLLLQNDFCEQASLHLAGDILKTMLRLQLIPDSQGKIFLLEQFGTANAWDASQPEGIRLADPLLMHAEMLLFEERNAALFDQLKARYVVPRMVGMPIELN